MPVVVGVQFKEVTKVYHFDPDGLLEQGPGFFIRAHRLVQPCQFIEAGGIFGGLFLGPPLPQLHGLLSDPNGGSILALLAELLKSGVEFPNALGEGMGGHSRQQAGNDDGAYFRRSHEHFIAFPFAGFRLSAVACRHG